MAAVIPERADPALSRRLTAQGRLDERVCPLNGRYRPFRVILDSASFSGFLGTVGLKHVLTRPDALCRCRPIPAAVRFENKICRLIENGLAVPRQHPAHFLEVRNRVRAVRLAVNNPQAGKHSVRHDINPNALKNSRSRCRFASRKSVTCGGGGLARGLAFRVAAVFDHHARGRATGCPSAWAVMSI